MTPVFDLPALVSAHQKGIWRYLRALGAEPALADDLTQETFLAVARRPFEVRDEKATAVYLRTVARNFFLKSRRHSSLSVDEIDQAEVLWVRLNPDDAGDVMLDALRECLKALDEQPRRALDLQFKEGRARAEIAQALGLTEDGLKSLQRRSKERLRLCVEKRIEGARP